MFSTTPATRMPVLDATSAARIATFWAAGLGAVERQGRSQVRRQRRLAHAALARGHRNDASRRLQRELALLAGLSSVQPLAQRGLLLGSHRVERDADGLHARHLADLVAHLL